MTDLGSEMLGDDISRHSIKPRQLGVGHRLSTTPGDRERFSDYVPSETVSDSTHGVLEDTIGVLIPQSLEPLVFASQDVARLRGIQIVSNRSPL